jgi:hypothetical protein
MADPGKTAGAAMCFLLLKSRSASEGYIWPRGFKGNASDLICIEDYMDPSLRFGISEEFHGK